MIFNHHHTSASSTFQKLDNVPHNAMKNYDTGTATLSIPKINSAFAIILSPSSSSKQLIKQADTYLRECESNPNFALTLMQIFSQADNQQTQWQTLIHLTNVVKRNWTVKRRTNESVCISEEIKNKIKNGLVDLYKMYWWNYSKQFNLLFKFLSKCEFPSNYPILQNFVMEILTTLANSTIQVLITPPQLLPYLSMVKTVYKQNSCQRIFHNSQHYQKHIAEPIKLAVIILKKVDTAIAALPSLSPQDFDFSLANKLLQCSRKIDKITLYCLQCAVGTQQTDPHISAIIEYMVTKLELLLGLENAQLKKQIELDILAVLEGLSRVQTTLPFAFTGFLARYLQVILNMLINKTFENQKLIKCLLITNSKPLVTFAYYSNQSQFASCIEARKSRESTFCTEQLTCHSQFMNIYGGNNPINFMETALTSLMIKYKPDPTEDEHLFEDTENCESSSELSIFQLLLKLLKNLMSRFKELFKTFASKTLLHLLQNNLSSTSSPLAHNMYEMVLLLPKVYDEHSLPLDLVFQLVEMTYINKDFGVFSRLIRCYNYFFSLSMACKAFEILVNVIATPDIDHQVIYHCAVCVKKMLIEHDEDEQLPLDNLGLCLNNLLVLVRTYKNVPTHLWSLLQLVTEILKLVNDETILRNLSCLIQNIEVLIEEKDNEQLIISAISDLLQNVLELTSSEQQQSAGNHQMLQYLYEISIKLINMHLTNPKLQNPQHLYKLWLSVIRSADIAKSSTALSEKLVSILHSFQDQLMRTDQVLFLQLIEQYILKNLISLTPQNIVSISEEVLKLVSPERRNQILMVVFSMYFSYFLTSGISIEKMLVLAIQIVYDLYNKISPSNNTLRTFILLIINHHLIVLGASSTFEIFTRSFDNVYQEWFWPYLWSLEYLNHKYACKVASIALLSSLDVLQRAQILLPQIDNCVPLEKIMKATSFQLQPIQAYTAISSYVSAYRTMVQPEQKRTRICNNNNKSIPLKYKLQIKTEWAEYDLTTMYREKFCPIVTRLGWTPELLEQRFQPATAIKIISLLTRDNPPNDLTTD